MEEINRMKELIDILNMACYQYYQLDNPQMTDKEYDKLYDELIELESTTKIIMSDSPTQKVQGFILDKLEKVKHSKPMLSAKKTKSTNEIKSFIGSYKIVGSWKLDGLTIVLRYKNGTFVQAITRGGGEVGEDVTHTVKTFKNVPMKLKYCVDLEVRGEGLISWNTFSEINSTLEEPYSHPRNLASGSVRQLDSSICKQRKLEFKAFELVQDGMSEYDFSNQGMDKYESLEYLKECGFDVVEHEYVTYDSLEQFINSYNPNEYDYPVDGLIFEVDDRYLARETGKTSHHENKLMAFKWKDDSVETTLRNIEWNTTRTGLCNPTAIFDTVTIDGAEVSRATLHNVSIVKKLQLGIGDKITVYKANMIIPKIEENLTKSNTYNIPITCPCCGEPLIIKCENESETLRCMNDNCSAKLISKLTHFVNKKGINIDGFSEATLETFIDNGYIGTYIDIYNLSQHKDKLYKLDGFGKKSIDKLLQSIENSKQVKLENFLYSLGIPNIGIDASKKISKYCNDDIDKFSTCINTYFDFSDLDGIGEVINESIHKWFENDNNLIDIFCKLEDILTFVKEEKLVSNLKDLSNMTFVITGSVNHYTNRDEIKSEIESLGGKVSGSVSAKTTYLINNDSTSTSGKNAKAKQLNIPIITEEEYIKLVGKEV